MTETTSFEGKDSLISSDDRFAILEVLYKYCELLDKFQFDQMSREVFTEDSTENHGYGLETVYGRQEIADQFARLMTPYEGSMHNLSNTRFQRRPGGVIYTRSYFRAYHWLKSTGPDPMRACDFMSTGEYQDEFVLTEQGWLIKNRVRVYVGPGPVALGTVPSGIASETSDA